MDRPAGELAVRAIAPLAAFRWIRFLWLLGVGCSGLGLNVVVSAEKLQVLRFAQG